MVGLGPSSHMICKYNKGRRLQMLWLAKILFNSVIVQNVHHEIWPIITENLKIFEKKYTNKWGNKSPTSRQPAWQTVVDCGFASLSACHSSALQILKASI